jgi:hypothetical protein
MITKYAIASQEDHALCALEILIRHVGGDPMYASIAPENLRLYETESEGLAALAEFRATYAERNYVPRSGLVRGAPEEWNLYKVQIHKRAEQVS